MAVTDFIYIKMEFETGNSQEFVTDQSHTHNSAQSSYNSFVSK